MTETTSRVVPAIGETIAAGRCASVLSSVDLPAFGGPRMATRTPSRTTSPRAPSWSSRPISARSACVDVTACASASVVMSSASSPKSMSASVYARLLRSAARHSSYCRRCAPPIWRSACFRCSSVSALIRSPSPSTSVMSIRPLRNAWRVNSPGSARRSPGSRPSASSAAATTAREPCVCSSTVSSPVNERAGNHRRAWSITSPGAPPSSADGQRSAQHGAPRLRQRAVAAWRHPQQHLARTAPTRAPPTRRRPGPDDSATHRVGDDGRRLERARRRRAEPDRAEADRTAHRAEEGGGGERHHRGRVDERDRRGRHASLAS